jgi:hypothetical protein
VRQVRLPGVAVHEGRGVVRRSPRGRHLSHVPHNQTHPLVVLELAHSLVVRHRHEALTVDLQNLVTNLEKK